MLDSAQNRGNGQNLPRGEVLDVTVVNTPPPDETWAFLRSTRFWAMTLTNASLVLLDPNFPTDKWYISVGKFCALEGAGFWGTKTIDRIGEKLS